PPWDVRPRRPLLGFLVRLVLVAAWAVLLPLDALGVQALVLGGEVVAVLTLAAREDDFISGHGTSAVAGRVKREMRARRCASSTLPAICIPVVLPFVLRVQS